MTELPRCRWCGRGFTPTAGRGRPRQFCRRACRQRDYEARQRSAAHGLDESELIVTRDELDELKDKLFVLRCAVDDVHRDLAGAPTRRDYADAVSWLLSACEPLVARPD